MEAHGNHKPKICKRYTRNKEKEIKKKPTESHQYTREQKNKKEQRTTKTISKQVKWQ